MIFNEIVLENFGTYKNRNTINLTLKEGKPVILIGGENGCGKTTLLDAFQLVLFGANAQCSNRGKLKYHEFLEKSINRDSDPEEGAAIELVLEFYTAGKIQKFRIRRAWSLRSRKVKERFSVFRIEKDSDKYDKVFSDNWPDYVEGIFPSKVSPFFLFNGEKIEQLADFENSGPLIHAAITSLLGLNYVDQLSADLLILEKKKYKELATLDEKNELEKIEQELAEIDKNLANLRAEEARLDNLIDCQSEKLKEIELSYRQQGGNLFEHRRELELTRDHCLKQVTEQEEDLRHIAAGSAPLLLVENLLKDISNQAALEKKAEKNLMLNDELKHRDERLISMLRSSSLNEDAISKANQFLSQDRDKRQKYANIDQYLHLSVDANSRVHALLHSELPDLQVEIPKKLTKLKESNNQFDALERSLAGIPEEETIATIISARHRTNEELSQLRFAHAANQEELRKAKYKREMTSLSLKRELERTAERRFESKDQRRVLRFSAKSRKTIDIFRHRVIRQHIDKIEANVLDAFKKLLRKKGLVNNLKISYETFQLQIFNQNEVEIPSDRLSAGERQLLATALLWGICRAAGKLLPTIIDTPLGRLDTSHRTNLINNYFTHASEQVLLLSTDEEIVGKYHDGLKPHISHHYLLKHQDVVGGTSVINGYFE